MTLQELVTQRLEAGAHEYGDVSSKRPPHELIQEIREEIADVLGWVEILRQALAGEAPEDFETHAAAAGVLCETIWDVIDEMDDEIAIHAWDRLTDQGKLSASAPAPMRTFVPDPHRLTNDDDVGRPTETCDECHVANGHMGFCGRLKK